MLKKLLTVTTAMAIFFAAHSQDSTKGTTTYTTSVDAYYRYDFNNQVGNNKTSFTNSINSFELGMASIRVDHSFGKLAATADLGFGRRAEEFSYNDGTGFGVTGNKYNTLAAIKQAYLSYQVSSKVKITAGKWATHIGWELVDAYANRNYSMSYGFSYGPFFHTGVKADISLGGKSAFMIGVANPTDFSSNSSGNDIVIAQFSTGSKDDKIKAYLNFQGGTDASGGKITQGDLVLNFVLGSKWGLNYDGTLQSYKAAGAGASAHNWSSNALYLNFDPTSKFGLTLREEYFSDKDGVKLYTATTPSVLAESVMATTLSANVKLGNLTLIPEFRFDNAKNEYYTDKDGKGSKSATSFILAATYKF